MKIKTINKGINILLAGMLLLFGTAYFMRGRLPQTEEIQPELLQEPAQSETHEDVFDFEYRQTVYEVMPRADYELWGLIVDRNDIGKFSDIYHDEDSVDLVDVCVVWGNNVKSDVFREMKFRSGSWTCYWSTLSNETWRAFSKTSVSNNHLIASDLAIQEQLRGLHKGDQIHVEGMLVDYKNTETGWTRRTSLNRTDTGNGACEVVFVKSVEILRAGQPFWFKAYELGWKSWLALLALKILLVSYESYKQTRTHAD